MKLCENPVWKTRRIFWTMNATDFIDWKEVWKTLKTLVSNKGLSCSKVIFIEKDKKQLRRDFRQNSKRIDWYLSIFLSRSLTHIFSMGFPIVTNLQMYSPFSRKKDPVIKQWTSLLAWRNIWKDKSNFQLLEIQENT